MRAVLNPRCFASRALLQDAPFVKERLLERRAAETDLSLQREPLSEPPATGFAIECTPRVEWLPYVEEALGPASVAAFGPRESGMFYVGTAHPPAVRAMEWLVSEVQSKMREAGVACGKGQPGHVYVAGSNWDGDNNFAGTSPVLTHALEQGTISLMGVLTDEQLESQMQRFRVFAAPLFNATGVATKNIYALSRGMPLVTTTAGLQGLGLSSKLDAHSTECPGAADVNDAADGFAQRVLLLQTSETLWTQRSRRGLEHVAWTLSTTAEASKLRVELGITSRSVSHLEHADLLIE